MTRNGEISFPVWAIHRDTVTAQTTVDCSFSIWQTRVCGAEEVRRVPFGRTGLKVSPLCLNFGAAGTLDQTVNTKLALETSARMALELGVASEEILRSKRDEGCPPGGPWVPWGGGPGILGASLRGGVTSSPPAPAGGRFGGSPGVPLRGSLRG